MAGRKSLSSKLPIFTPPSPFTPFLRRFTDERARDLSDTIALYNEVERAHRSSVWAQSDVIVRVNNHCADITGKLVSLPAYLPLGRALDHCQTNVIRLEDTIVSFP